MIGNENNPETIQKKLENLDNEINTFIQVIREVKEIKESASVLQEGLVIHEGEIKQQKKELDQLIATTKHLGINIEEQTKGVIFDLEMKTGALIHEIKSGISQISDICSKGNAQLHEKQNETLHTLLTSYEETKKGCDILKIMVDAHEQKIRDINNGFSDVLKSYEKMESSFNELKKTVNEFQKRPYEIDNKLNKMEERLELSINEKYSRQKNITMIMLVILIATIFLSVINFYLS